MPEIGWEKFPKKIIIILSFKILGLLKASKNAQHSVPKPP